MSSSSAVKHQARLFLKNNWGKAIAILAVTMTFASVFSILLAFSIEGLTRVFQIDIYEIDSYSNSDSFLKALVVMYSTIFIVYLVRFLLESPFTLGAKGWHYSLVSGGDAQFGKVFEYYSRERYGRSIGYAISRFFRLLAWDLLVIVPFIAIIAGLDNFSSSIVFPIQFALSGIMLISVVVVHIIVSFNYFLVPYILAINPDIPISQAFRTSIHYMKGFRGEVFVLMISFAAWNLLKILAVPVMFVSPYYEASLANSAKWIIHTNLQKAQETLES